MNSEKRLIRKDAVLIIPAYNAEKTLPSLIGSLERQTVSIRNRVLIDDGSTDATAEIGEQYFRVIPSEKKRSGPGQARNYGISQTHEPLLVFFDSDCVPEPDCVERLLAPLEDDRVAAVMGSVRIMPAGYLRDSIAALGFPGGGSTGFEKIWHVTQDGFTDHISSLNFAIRRSVFEAIGGFDPDFAFSCEDAELSIRMRRAGFAIQFAKDARVAHPAEDSFRSFVKDHLRRGRGNYVLKKKIGSVGSLVKMRVWSAWNIVRRWWNDPKFIMILALLMCAFVLQQVGFFLASSEAKKN